MESFQLDFAIAAVMKSMEYRLHGVNRSDSTTEFVFKRDPNMDLYEKMDAYDKLSIIVMNLSMCGKVLVPDRRSGLFKIVSKKGMDPESCLIDVSRVKKKTAFEICEKFKEYM